MRNSAGRQGAAFFWTAGDGKTVSVRCGKPGRGEWECRAGRRRDERPRRPAQEAGQRGRGHRGRPETGRKDRDVRSGIERQTAGRLRQKSRNVVRVPD